MKLIATLFLTASLLSYMGTVHSKAIDWRIGVINDSMGIGFTSEWDDCRTYGLDFGLITDNWEAGLELVSLTKRDKPESSHLRIDMIQSQALWHLKFPLVKGVTAGLDIGPGVRFTGNFGFEKVQELWHRSTGVLRPFPAEYDPNGKFDALLHSSLSIEAALSAAERNDSKVFTRLNLPIRALLSGPLEADSIFTLGESSFCSLTAFSAGYGFRGTGYQNETLSYLALNMEGLWLEYIIRLNGLEFRNRTYPGSGIMDCTLSFTTADLTGGGSNDTRWWGLGVVIGRYTLSSHYAFRPAFFEPLSDRLALFADWQIGDRTIADRLNYGTHWQQATIGLEWALLEEKPSLAWTPYLSGGIGFKNELIYPKEINQLRIETSLVYPAGLLTTGFRCTYLVPIFGGLRWGLDVSANLLIPITAERAVDFYPSLRLLTAVF